MKKMRELLWMLLPAILLPIALGGCGGGGDEAVSKSRVATDRPAVLLGEMPDLDFMPALERRLTNRTEGEIADDTEVIVLHDRTIASLTDAQKVGLKKVYERGGIVVLVEPTYDELTEAAGIVGHELAAAEDRGAEHFCDLYAFGDDWHTYVMGHTHGDHATGDETSLDCTGGGAHYEELMDDLAAWIDRGGPTKAPSQNRGAATSVDITVLAKEQTLTHMQTVSHPSMSRHPTVKNIYFIQALYDFDHDYDYYFVDRQTTINSELAYVPTWTDFKTHHFFGYWLYSYDTDTQLEGALQAGQYRPIALDTCQLIQPVPETDIGTQGYTLSQRYTVSASVGFSGLSGSGSLSFGASYSKSHSMEVADLLIVLRAGEDFAGQFTGTGNAAWHYQAQNLPLFKRPLRLSSKLASEPPAISVTTAVFYNNWIWRVKNPRAYEGSFQAACTYYPVYTLNHIYPQELDILVDENTFRYDAKETTSFLLTPPPRERPRSEADDRSVL